jgi:acetylornithine/N-succinyldiaminopimelate aminotransferase
VLRVMQDEDVPGRAEKAGARLVAGLSGISRVRAVRGLGLLIALEVDDDAPALARRLLDRGLVVNAVTPTAIRLAPSLLITDGEIDEALTLLAQELS